MISTVTNREEKRNFIKIFLFLSNEYQLSSPSLLLAIYGINYCQTNLYVCLLESTPLFHFSSFFMCFLGVSFSCLHLCNVLMEAIIIILGMLYKCRGKCCVSTLRKENIYTFETMLDRKLEMKFDTFYPRLIISNIIDVVE